LFHGVVLERTGFGRIFVFFILFLFFLFKKSSRISVYKKENMREKIDK